MARLESKGGLQDYHREKREVAEKAAAEEEERLREVAKEKIEKAKLE